LAKVDSLGFTTSALALAEMIVKRETQPPVVFGIYGSWGSGKSNLMLYVQQYLEDWEKQRRQVEKKAKQIRQRIARMVLRRPEEHTPYDNMSRIAYVKFNAWAYTDSAKLWAGLVRTVSESLDAESKWWRKAWYALRHTTWQFLGAFILTVLPLLLTILLAAATSLMSEALNQPIVKAVLIGLGGALSTKVGAISLDKGKPLTKVVSDELNNLDKSEMEGVANRVQKEFQTAIRKNFALSEEKSTAVDPQTQTTTAVHQAKLKLVVFIDELDRCPLERIVDILEAIKLFLAEEIFIVLMAVDTRIAAEAIRLHYKEVKNPDLAREYLEKIIQVPVPVPVADHERLTKYVDSLMSIKREAKKITPLPGATSAGPNALDEAHLSTTSTTNEPFKLLELPDTDVEEQAIVEFAQQYLESNPRRIKRLLNTYRYVKIMSQRGGTDTNKPEWQTQMIQWLGATMRWPIFVAEAVRLAEAGSADHVWADLCARIATDLCPPDNLVELLPATNGDIVKMAETAGNFLKENPPYPDEIAAEPQI
jgi:hypothetical protein